MTASAEAGVAFGIKGGKTGFDALVMVKVAAVR